MTLALLDTPPPALPSWPLPEPVGDALARIAARIGRGERIGVDDARTLWLHASDHELMRLAGIVRARYHAPDRATYTVMRIINYTNGRTSAGATRSSSTRPPSTSRRSGRWWRAASARRPRWHPDGGGAHRPGPGSAA